MKIVPRNSPVAGMGRPPVVAESPEILSMLLLGDEAHHRRLLSFGILRQHDVATRISSPDALASLNSADEFNVALLDWEMTSAAAPALLEGLRLLDATLPVVTLVADERSGRTARRLGAHRCLVKPCSTEDVKTVLHAAARTGRSEETEMPAAGLLPAKAAAESRDAAIPAFSLESASPPMQAILRMAERVAPTPASILLLGENGTGKSALARGIHDRSLRSQQPFVTVSCPSLQAQLLESDLFGHVRGAFTGAVSDGPGKVAAAEGGTLFLDEIGELPPAIQPKLLRLLQSREYERVGETRTRFADIRVLAATNRDLRAEVQAGHFREDLFYRLNVITLELPPLRRRTEDLLGLAEKFLDEIMRDAGMDDRKRGFTPAARQALLRHVWPGNLRELRNAVERAAILSDRAQLDAADFPLVLEASTTVPQVGDAVSLAQLEEAHIREVVARSPTLSHAARVLGIDQATLYRKRKRVSDWMKSFALPQAV